MLPLLRSFNHNLGAKLMKLEGEVGREEAGNIEALKSVAQYYRLLEMSMGHFEDYEYFEAHCSIKVNVDYKKSGAVL